MPLHPDHHLCAGTTRKGTPCGNLPVTGSTFCRQHGGAEENSGGRFQPGNNAARRHGAYSTRLVSVEERSRYDAMAHALSEDFDARTPAAQGEVEKAAFHFVKWLSAAATDGLERQTRFRFRLLRNIEALKEIRERNRVPVPTPAEWAANLLERVRRARRGY